MTRRIVIQPDAVNDLDEIAAFLSQSRRDLGFRFNEAAEKGFQLLAGMPRLGSPQNFKDPSLADLRCWRVPKFEKYLIFYRPTVDGIVVVRVLHGARDIDSLLEGEGDEGRGGA